MKEKAVRICHIVSRITGRDDGIFKHLLAQFTLLDGNVFSHTLICPYSEEIEDEVNRLGINAFFVPEIDTNNYLRSAIKIGKILVRYDFDIVCCHTLKPLIFGGFLNLFNKRKIFFFSHGIFLNNDYNSKFEKVLYKILIKVLLYIRKVIFLCPSEWNKEKLINELGKNLDIKVYYDGAAVIQTNDSSIFTEVENKIKSIKTKFKIIFAGRLAREKNPMLAIDIFKELNSDDISLHIFGEGELMSDLMDFVTKLNLKNIFFYGFVRNVNKYFNLFDLLLLTSKREGMPIVIWEAMYAGLPFLAKNVGGISEILKYGEFGYIFEEKNEAVEKIKYLLSKADLLQKMSRNGKAVISENFSKEKFVDYFSKLYLNLL